jgi:cell shape-determining protein MreC
VRGAFREADRLMLNGTPYHETIPEGVLVVTSGMGFFPRGIPVGTIDATAEVRGQWLKSYWLRPAVEPGSATHVLVETEGGPTDLSAIWPVDSVASGAEGADRGLEP